MPLEKACLRVLESCNAGGVSFNENDKIYAQFNPEKYSVSASPYYSFSAKEGRMLAQYSGEDSRAFTAELFVDSLSASGSNRKGPGIGAAAPNIEELMEKAGSVSGYANKIMALTRPAKEKGAPPMVEFMWGGITVKGVISSASINYSLFNSKGEPIRATVQLTIKECDDVQKSGSTSQLKLSVLDAAKTAGVSLPDTITEAEVMNTVIKALKQK